MSKGKNKPYRRSVHEHLANGETNRSDGAWTTDIKGREGDYAKRAAANATRNKRSRGQVRATVEQSGPSVKGKGLKRMPRGASKARLSALGLGDVDVFDVIDAILEEESGDTIAMEGGTI
jgi:hypothetical protein